MARGDTPSGTAEATTKRKGYTTFLTDVSSSYVKEYVFSQINLVPRVFPFSIGWAVKREKP